MVSFAPPGGVRFRFCVRTGSRALCLYNFESRGTFFFVPPHAYTYREMLFVSRCFKADTPSNNRQPTLAQLPVEKPTQREYISCLHPEGQPLISSKRGRKQLHEASGGSYPPIFSYLKICSSVSLSVSPYSLVFCTESLRIPVRRPLMIDLLVHVFSSPSVLYRSGATEKNSGDCFVQNKKASSLSEVHTV